jgi:hypothetical protein
MTKFNVSGYHIRIPIQSPQVQKLINTWLALRVGKNLEDWWGPFFVNEHTESYCFRDNDDLVSFKLTWLYD